MIRIIAKANWKYQVPLELYPYQKEGVQRLLDILLSEDGANAALLADPIGAGKTAQAIGVMRALGARRTLIICPKSLKLNWAREVKLWAALDPVVLRSAQDPVPEAACHPVVIANYHLACREPLKTLLRSSDRWDLLILDEAHAIKSPESTTSRVCAILLWSHARYRLAITGTPVPNGRASEAWVLFSRMWPSLFAHWPSYRDRYCVAEPLPAARGGGFWYPRSRNLQELGDLARKHFMVRRNRDEVLSQLPEMVRAEVPLEIPALKVTETMESVDLSMLEALLESGGVPSPTDPISTARRKLGVLKAPAALEFILELLEDSESPLLVFCHHREVFFFLAQGLDDAGVTFVGINGNTPADERQGAVDAFQGGQARVALLSITAANSGITLTRASTVVFVEWDWVDVINQQAEGRIHRIGQRAEICRAMYLYAPNSLDEAVLRVNRRKRRDVERLMNPRPAEALFPASSEGVA